MPMMQVYSFFKHFNQLIAVVIRNSLQLQYLRKLN